MESRQECTIGRAVARGPPPPNEGQLPLWATAADQGDAQVTLDEADAASQVTLDEADVASQVTLDEADAASQVTLDEADAASQVTLDEADAASQVTLDEADAASQVTLHEADVASQVASDDGDVASQVASDDGDVASQVTSDEGGLEIVPMTAAPVRGGHMVQHVGCWILLALAKELGLHDDAYRAFGPRNHDGLRIALDAVICSLAIYQRCIEGVRRLATPTGPTLLRAKRVPTASGVRKLFGRLLSETEIGGAILDARVTTRFIAAAHADEGPAIFYVDGHMRRYHGKHVVRKGWRMQDRRVLPGSTDYYVHDEDGRPVFRIPVPSHDSLTAWLQPIAMRLREGLGDDERILLAFDRGGAFSKQLAELRDAGIEFVTYERAPYPKLAERAFDRTVVVRGETYQLHESRNKNLGDKRGRIRRIALRSPDGKQINLVAISTASAEQLVAILLGAPALKLTQWTLAAGERFPSWRRTLGYQPTRRPRSRALPTGHGHSQSCSSEA